MFSWTGLNIYLRVFLVALFASYLGTPIIRDIARRLKILDYPNSRKSHSVPVPRGGGIAIYGAYALAVVLTLWYSNPLKGIVIGGFIVLLVGIFDDLRGGIPAPVKFITLIIISYIVTRYGVILNLFQNVYLDSFLTILWIAGITSAFNAIDNTDGLASGVALIACLFYFIIASYTRQWWLGMLSIGLVGSNLGFLRYNIRKASIFMGDSGSFFLGFTIAAIAVMGEWTESTFRSCFIPILILGVPIFDMSFIVIRRRLRGITHNVIEDLTHCAKDHLSHQLMKMGFSRGKAVLFIYLMAMCLGILALLVKIVDSDLFAFGLGLGVLGAFLWGAKKLSQVD